MRFRDQALLGLAFVGILIVAPLAFAAQPDRVVAPLAGLDFKLLPDAPRAVAPEAAPLANLPFVLAMHKPKKSKCSSCTAGGGACACSACDCPTTSSTPAKPTKPEPAAAKVTNVPTYAEAYYEAIEHAKELVVAVRVDARTAIAAERAAAAAGRLFAIATGADEKAFTAGVHYLRPRAAGGLEEFDAPNLVRGAKSAATTVVEKNPAGSGACVNCRLLRR